MDNWNYYVLFEPPASSAGKPDNVIRQQPGALRDDAEILTPGTGTWQPTDLLARIHIGIGDDEVEAVSQDRAAELAQGWLARGQFADLPADLQP